MGDRVLPRNVRKAIALLRGDPVRRGQVRVPHTSDFLDHFAEGLAWLGIPVA